MGSWCRYSFSKSLTFPPGFPIPLGRGGMLWRRSSGGVSEPQRQIHGLSWTERKSAGVRASRGECHLSPLMGEPAARVAEGRGAGGRTGVVRPGCGCAGVTNAPKMLMKSPGHGQYRRTGSSVGIKIAGAKPAR